MLVLSSPPVVVTASLALALALAGTPRGRRFIARRYLGATRALVALANRAPRGARFALVTAAIVTLAPAVLTPVAAGRLRRRLSPVVEVQLEPVEYRGDAGGRPSVDGPALSVSATPPCRRETTRPRRRPERRGWPPAARRTYATGVGGNPSPAMPASSPCAHQRTRFYGLSGKN